jgi:hypothetical protein
MLPFRKALFFILSENAPPEKPCLREILLCALAFARFVCYNGGARKTKGNLRENEEKEERVSPKVSAILRPS